MAQKKRKKKTSWVKIVLFVILTPLIVWTLAFVIWLYWKDLAGPSDRDDKAPASKANRPIDRPTKRPGKVSQEGINEEDRRKLEELLEKEQK